MTKHGKEILAMEFHPFVTTHDAILRLIEDLRISVAEIFMVENMDAVCSSVPDTCTLGEVKMRHNYVLNVCGMTINLTSQNQTQSNGLDTK